jgi:hypothetical protein
MLEMHHFSFLTFYFKALRLLHIELLIKLSIQKGGFDIQSLDVPFFKCHKGNHHLDCLKPYHWREYFIIIAAFYLRKAFGNKSSFLAPIRL